MGYIYYLFSEVLSAVGRAQFVIGTCNLKAGIAAGFVHFSISTIKKLLPVKKEMEQ
jgi:hypothetical protein